MIAGIGLFFSGVKIVSTSMKNLTSHKFRLLVAKLTGNSFLAAFWGFISGAISQSSSNTVFILIGLVSSDLMNVRNALPIIAWSNVGTTVLIFLVAINLKLSILILLGFSGIFFGFDKGSRRENLYSALFGISMLLFGFQLLKSGSQPFAQLEFINNMFQYTANSYILPIFLGALLRLIIHSSSTVTVLIMTISHAGLIGLDQVILMIYGMGLGEAGTVLLLSSGVKGTSKELPIFKVIESFFGFFLLIILFSIEIIWNIPLVKYLVICLGSNIEHQTAFIFLISKIAPIPFLSFFYTPIYKLLLKLSPPTSEEDLSKTKFINEQSLSDVNTALILIENEQNRIFERFPEYINNIRSDEESITNIDFTIIRKSNLVLLNEIDLYLKRIINLNLSHGNSEIFVFLQNRQNLIKSLDDSVYHFVSTIFDNNSSSELDDLMNNFIEALHANLITAIEAMKSKDIIEIDILLNITDDKGSLMEKIRKIHLSDNMTLNADNKAVLLYITDLFQRTIWLINGWAKFLKSSYMI
jgi:phosphate:Na+ symporter